VSVRALSLVGAQEHEFHRFRRIARIIPNLAGAPAGPTGPCGVPDVPLRASSSVRAFQEQFVRFAAICDIRGYLPAPICETGGVPTFLEVDWACWTLSLRPRAVMRNLSSLFPRTHVRSLTPKVVVDVGNHFALVHHGTVLVQHGCVAGCGCDGLPVGR